MANTIKIIEEKFISIEEEEAFLSDLLYKNNMKLIAVGPQKEIPFGNFYKVKFYLEYHAD